MEKRKGYSRNFGAEITLGKIIDEKRKRIECLETRLAEKEKEIEKFKTYIKTLEQELGPFQFINNDKDLLDAIRTGTSVLVHNTEILKTRLAEKEKEIKELKEKARHLAEDIWRWFAELKKISLRLNKSRAFFKSETIAEARKETEKVADEMQIIIRTWSI